MGRYLQTGILYDMSVKKEKSRYRGAYTKEEILQEVAQKINWGQSPLW